MTLSSFSWGLLLWIVFFFVARPSILAQDDSLPGATTLPATPIGAVQATLHGSVVPGQSAALVHFEFSTDP